MTKWIEYIYEQLVELEDKQDLDAAGAHLLLWIRRRRHVIN
jgi:hypothetical protein